MVFKNHFGKKFLAGLLSTSIIFSSASMLNVSAITGTDSYRRYDKDNLVLLLDIPENISKNDLSKVKSETLDFCKSCIDMSDNLQISVASSNSDEKLSDFTRDISSLENSINKVESSNQMDFEAAVNKVDQLFKNTEKTSSNKLVILSDADVEVSKQIDASEEQELKDSDEILHENYKKHIVEAKGKAVELKERGIDSYSVGLLLDKENILNSDASDSLKEIQTKGYHEISNLDNLNEVYSYISKDLTDEAPIIFIPGILGSRLFEDPECNSVLWTPEGSVPQMLRTLSSAKTKMKIDVPLYVNKPVDQNKLSTDKREYGATQIYKNMIDSLCQRFPDKEVYFFSYDFRKSNVENGRILNDFINSLDHQKVNIVAHSMGGLVSANYISENGDSKINKIILVGSPLEGAPQLLNAVMHWEIAGNGLLDTVLGLAGLVKDVKASYKSTAEMYPTKNYFDQVGFFVRDRYDWIDRYYTCKKIDYKTYQKYGKVIFSDNYEEAVKEQEKINVDGINVLSTLDNSYFLFGTGMHTVKSVEFKDANNLYEMDTIDDKNISDLLYENTGDGTVPYLSYTAMENVNEKVKPDHIAYFNKMSHTNIAGSFGKFDKRSKSEKQAPIDWILDVIEKGYSDKAQDKPSESKNFTVLKIDDNAEITVKKDGKVLSSSADDFSVNSDFGRLDLVGENNGIKILAIDDDTDYEISMNAKQAGNVDYSVRWYGSDEILLEERDFIDVPVEENTKIVTSIDKDSDTKLVVDTNGDGKEITEIAPSVVTKNDTAVCGLSDIVLSKGKLSPDFATNTLDYEVLVDNQTDIINIAPKATDNSDIVISTDNTLKTISADESVDIDLKVGNNKIKMDVINENGNSVSYNLCVVRGVPLTEAINNTENQDVISLMDKRISDARVLESDYNSSDESPEQNDKNISTRDIARISIAIALIGTVFTITIRKKLKSEK